VLATDALVDWLLVVALAVVVLLLGLLLLLPLLEGATLDSVATSLEVVLLAATAAAVLAGCCFFVGLRLGSLLVALPLPEVPPISVGQSPTLLKSLACKVAR